jgi:hypothetical protein
VNAKKVYRIYNESGLQLRNKTSKRRVKAKLRDDRRPATQPNETWSMDFVHDQLATGKKIRVLTVVDTRHEDRYAQAIQTAGKQPSGGEATARASLSAKSPLGVP